MAVRVVETTILQVNVLSSSTTPLLFILFALPVCSFIGNLIYKPAG